MSCHRIVARVGAALVAALVVTGTAPSRAETWTISIAPYQYILTVSSTASGGFEPQGQLGASDDSDKRLTVVGKPEDFIVRARLADPDDPGHMRSRQCMFRTTSVSAAVASGTGYCDGKEMNWTAAITGEPVDRSPPTLLVGSADPQQSARYAALDATARNAAEAAAATYMDDMKSMPFYTFLRDLDCLERQFLNIRVQRPGWSQQDIHEYISLTCIAPAQVLKMAASRCKGLYGDNSVFVVRHLASFCNCYAKNYSEAFVANPNNSTLYESELGVAAVRACRAADSG